MPPKQTKNRNSSSTEYIKITVTEATDIVSNLTSFEEEAESGLKNARIELCTPGKSGKVCHYVDDFSDLCKNVPMDPDLMSVNDTIEVQIYFQKEDKTT